jgi:hypothetical protein
MLSWSAMIAMLSDGVSKACVLLFVVGSVGLLLCKCLCGGTCVVSYKERLQRDTEDGFYEGRCGISGGGEEQRVEGSVGRNSRWR